VTDADDRKHLIPFDRDAQVEVPLSELAYRTVRQAIQAGYLRPGEHLSELRLTKELGISRTPIRDALRRLEADRWLQRKRAGLVVTVLSAQDITNLYAVREALESYAVRIAAQRATPRRVKDLRRANREFRLASRKQRTADAVRFNIEFHEQLNALAGNDLLSSLIAGLSEQVSLLPPLAATDPKLSEMLADQHDRIIDAVEQGSADQAERAVREHLRSAERAYVRLLSSAPQQPGPVV
jgi:DNA-binding GntR family transcriptional regulator